MTFRTPRVCVFVIKTRISCCFNIFLSHSTSARDSRFIDREVFWISLATVQLHPWPLRRAAESVEVSLDGLATRVALRHGFHSKNLRWRGEDRKELQEISPSCIVSTNYSPKMIQFPRQVTRNKSCKIPPKARNSLRRCYFCLSRSLFGNWNWDWDCWRDVGPRGNE